MLPRTVFKQEDQQQQQQQPPLGRSVLASKLQTWVAAALHEGRSMFGPSCVTGGTAGTHAAIQSPETLNFKPGWQTALLY